MEAVQHLSDAHRPNLWILTELPIESAKIPQNFLDDLEFQCQIPLDKV